MIDENDLRQEIIRITRLAAGQGLMRSSDGNVSVRLDEGRLLVTPSGFHKLNMAPDDLVVVDEAGQPLACPPGRRPSSELKLHLEAYRQRPDVRAVLHAHPPYATALTLAGLPFPTDYLPEVLMALGSVPTVPYGRPGTAALASTIRDQIRDHDNMLLSHHGSLSVGQTLEQTLINLERLEQAAYIYFLARQIGEPLALPAAELAAIARRENG